MARTLKPHLRYRGWMGYWMLTAQVCVVKCAWMTLFATHSLKTALSRCMFIQYSFSTKNYIVHIQVPVERLKYPPQTTILTTLQVVPNNWSRFQRHTSRLPTWWTKNVHICWEKRKVQCPKLLFRTKNSYCLILIIVLLYNRPCWTRLFWWVWKTKSLFTRC